VLLVTLDYVQQPLIEAVANLCVGDKNLIFAEEPVTRKRHAFGGHCTVTKAKTARDDGSRAPHGEAWDDIREYSVHYCLVVLLSLREGSQRSLTLDRDKGVCG
jgi:hypothetical protein